LKSGIYKIFSDRTGLSEFGVKKMDVVKRQNGAALMSTNNKNKQAGE
jgi:hypothetical protein